MADPPQSLHRSALIASSSAIDKTMSADSRSSGVECRVVQEKVSAKRRGVWTRAGAPRNEATNKDVTAGYDVVKR